MPATEVSEAEPLPWPCNAATTAFSFHLPIQPKLPCAQVGSCELCAYAAGIVQTPLNVTEQLLLVLLVVLNLLLQSLRSVHSCPRIDSTGRPSHWQRLAEGLLQLYKQGTQNPGAFRTAPIGVRAVAPTRCSRRVLSCHQQLHTCLL